MANLPLASLKDLRDQLEDHDWAITWFRFRYRGTDYFILVQRYIPPLKQPDKALVQLTFIDRTINRDPLVAPANRLRVMTDPQTLRSFFGIRWAPNLGDILRQFSETLGRSVPTNLPTQLPQDSRHAVLAALSTGDAEDPRKIYCTSVRRNPERSDGTPGQRSAFNSQKTELLRPHLYQRLKDDRSLSFRYSTQQEHEKTDDQILELFARRQEAAT